MRDDYKELVGSRAAHATALRFRKSHQFASLARWVESRVSLPGWLAVSIKGALGQGGNMVKFPDAVQRLREKFIEDPSQYSEYGSVPEKLLRDDPEIAGMWRAIEKHSYSGDPWPLLFIARVHELSNLPPFHYASLAARKTLSSKIEQLAAQLAEELEKNKLDLNLLFSDGKLFHGFFFYEDFGESNQARIDYKGDPKVAVTVLIREVASRARKRIEEEPGRGKTGKNVRAIRFIRLMTTRNRVLLGRSLIAVTMVVTNALFDTRYEQSDITNLMRR